MASRDKSQGFGFMYLDLSQVMQQKNQSEKNSEAPLTPVANVTTLNFNKDKVHSPSEPTQLTKERLDAIQQIRENLDRLQALHHKLHAMLEELNKLTEKKR